METLNVDGKYEYVWVGAVSTTFPRNFDSVPPDNITV